jgi:hypothetical protein
VLDLAAGSGEVTRAVRACRPGAKIEAIDPHTADAYTHATGLPCERLDFASLAAGALEGRRYTLIVCSFAMHLCPPSHLPALCVALARTSPRLAIVTPHKRPVIRPGWGWSTPRESVHDRVRIRIYHRLDDELYDASVTDTLAGNQHP